MSIKSNENEIGSTTSICLLFSIILILGLHNYWPIIQERLMLPYQLTLIACSLIFILFSLLSGLYSVFSGEKSTGQLRREIIRETRKLDKLTSEARSAVNNLESQLRTLSGIMHPAGFRNLKKLKAMLACLEGRCDKARKSLKSRDRYEIEQAYIMFFSDIGEYEDVFNHLVLDDFVESYPYDKIPNELHRTLKSVEQSLPKRSSTIH